MRWTERARRILAGEALKRDEALAILRTGDEELLDLLNAAFLVRSRDHDRRVRLHVLQNAKSGACPEDCKFCSQSVHFDAPIERYGMQSVEDLVAGAERAAASGAVTYCMVTSTTGPNSREMETVCEATREIKRRFGLRVCASLGTLDDDKARTLREAGVDRYNHNLETSSGHFSEVVSSHTWEDRAATVRRAKAAGMEACCGGIVGIGESQDDRVDLAYELRELEVESIPVNFLDPRMGTPLGDRDQVAANDALRALAMVRLVNDTAQDIRVAGGREVVLGTQQPLALWAANSIFTEGYLTTGGQDHERDVKMIRAAGFEPEVVSEGATA